MKSKVHLTETGENTQERRRQKGLNMIKVHSTETSETTQERRRKNRLNMTKKIVVKSKHKTKYHI